MELPWRLCKYCRKEKTWVWNQKRLKDGSKVFVNETNHRWAGRRCPDCEKERVRAALTLDEFTRDLLEGELLAQGYEITSKKKFPILVEKDGRQFVVRPIRAHMQNGKIEVAERYNHFQKSKKPGQPEDLLIFLFNTVRLLPLDQAQALVGIKAKSKRQVVMDHI